MDIFFALHKALEKESIMNDQQSDWNKIHSSSNIKKTGPSNFAKEVLKVVPKESKILELGCGIGVDAASFASAGHKVLATDFSEVVIAKNQFNFSSVQSLQFQTLDIKNLSQFLDNEFDVVYAHLSLHYFPDLITRKVFSEIHRILRRDGLLCFIVKSTKDPLFGIGLKIEENMYQDEERPRHFFDKKYTESLLKKKFKIQELIEGNENFYNKDSAFIAVIAKTIK